jgi:hypothetical protein
MTRIALAAMLALSAAPAFADEAKPSAAKKGNAKPTLDAEEEVVFTATVKSVDQKTRVVTLTGKGGEEVKFTADERVKNLAQVKVGDGVTVELHNTLKARVLKPGEAVPKGSQDTTLVTAPPGAKPGGHATKYIHVIATVAAIDVPNMVVTLKAANGQTWPVKAQSKTNIQMLQVGDLLDIQSTKSIAVAVTSSAAK